jgi:leucyl aminopeptidase
MPRVPGAPGPSLTLTDIPAVDISTDVLIVSIFEDDLKPPPEVAPVWGGLLEAAIRSGEFRGKPFEMLWLSLAGQARGQVRRLLALGAGRRADYGLDRARKLAAAGALAARQRRLGRVALLDMDGGARPAVTQAFAEGLMLAAFDGDVYRTGDRETVPLTEAALVGVKPSADRDQALLRGRVLGAATNVARALAVEPGNVLTPTVFAERAGALASDHGLDVTIFDQDAMAKWQMGLLLGVARGSAEPPRLIVLRHKPEGLTSGPVLGLVGKGITFDSGGISIKPAEGMDRMKDDMAGGAAVIAAMCAIARLGAPIRVVGIVPTTENMPGGRALKPGDVLHSAAGKTVEVLNTDAEGRLVLGDALWYARTHERATHLVDVATLTGAVVVALGKIASGLFGTPAWWLDAVRDAADRAGDRVWPLPLFDEYAEQIRSEIADMANVGGRPAGAITAAMFLKEFAGGLPWTHLDIAGTAWADEAKPYQPKGASGVAVRTLAELALSAESWSKNEAAGGEGEKL